MVNRVTASAASLDASEAVTVHEAIEAYTTLGAYAGREEHIKGRLAPGMLADFCVLDRDIFTIHTSDIHNVGVTATYVAGAPVYQRD